jgi:hypothetical protein
MLLIFAITFPYSSVFKIQCLSAHEGAAFRRPISRVTSEFGLHWSGGLDCRALRLRSQPTLIKEIGDRCGHGAMRPACSFAVERNTRCSPTPTASLL